MQTIQHHTDCPICGSASVQPVLTATDHTVSHEIFEIWECSGCTARFTQNAPEADSIGRYYKSDNYISHSNTSRGLVNKLYHRVRRITLEQKRKLIGKMTGLQAGSLLDVGAGTGLFADAMRRAGWKVTGLEPDAAARERAREMNILLQDIADLHQLPPESYDAITLWHVLEHVHDVHGYLDRLKTLLKPEGRLLIAVPNFTSADARTYGAFWAAYDVPRHLWHFSPRSMQLLLKQHGFSTEKMYPQWFDSFYVSMLSEQYKTGSSNIIKGAWNGLMSNMQALTSVRRCSSVIYIARKS
jgi:SAM-dependent methyltransferase